MASTFNGINPGIDSDIVVVTIVAGRMTVTVTSDLDPAYDDDLQRLATMDYSGVGGNPITQYHDGLRSIHLEGFSNKVGYDFNFQGNGAIGTGYSLTSLTRRVNQLDVWKVSIQFISILMAEERV